MKMDIGMSMMLIVILVGIVGFFSMSMVDKDIAANNIVGQAKLMPGKAVGYASPVKSVPEEVKEESIDIGNPHFNELDEIVDCIEHDGGDNPFVMSHTTVYYDDDEPVIYSDTCEDDYELTEYFCNVSLGAEETQYNCEYGCASGRCLTEEWIDPGYDIERSFTRYQDFDTGDNDVGESIRAYLLNISTNISHRIMINCYQENVNVLGSTYTKGIYAGTDDRSDVVESLTVKGFSEVALEQVECDVRLDYGFWEYEETLTQENIVLPTFTHLKILREIGGDQYYMMASGHSDVSIEELMISVDAMTGDGEHHRIGYIDMYPENTFNFNEVHPIAFETPLENVQEIKLVATVDLWESSDSARAERVYTVGDEGQQVTIGDRAFMMY